MTRPRLRPLLGATLAATLLVLAPGLAGANECPERPPGNNERRALAKEFFSRAESAERAGDDLAAIKAYACSMRMVPHPFTAYNLARVAEKAGDLDLALSSYRHYLTLKPDAQDRPDIEKRIASLEDRIAAVRDAASVPEPARPPEPAPEPSAAPEPPPVLRTAESPPARDEERPLLGPTEWVIAGVGAAALVAGVVFNVGARSKMNDCRSLAGENRLAAARDACDAARPFAYTSYALFGAAGVAAVADLVLIWGRRNETERLAVAPLPGGLALSWGGRF